MILNGLFIDLCPCGRTSANLAKPAKLQPLPFAACCGPYLNDNIPDAESLMRSRYSAFVLERANYLLATWHASTRPAALDFAPGASEVAGAGRAFAPTAGR
jgi:SEC-C motif-containing protein